MKPFTLENTPGKTNKEIFNYNLCFGLDLLDFQSKHRRDPNESEIKVLMEEVVKEQEPDKTKGYEIVETTSTGLKRIYKTSSKEISYNKARKLNNRSRNSSFVFTFQDQEYDSWLCFDKVDHRRRGWK